MLFQKLLFLFLIISVQSRPQLQPSSWISQIVNTAVQKVSPVIGLSGSNEQTHQAHSGSVENQQGNTNFGGYSQVQNVGGNPGQGQNSNPNYPGPASGWSMLPLGLGNKSPASNNYKSGLNQQQNQQQPQSNQYQQQSQQQFNTQSIQQQIQNLPNQPQNVQQPQQQQHKESIFSSVIGGGNKVLGNGPIRQSYKSPYPNPNLNIREESASSEENDSDDEKPARKPAVKKSKPKIKKQKPKNKAKPKAKPVAKKPAKTSSTNKKSKTKKS